MVTDRSDSMVYFELTHARARVFGYTPTPVGRDSIRPWGED